MLDALAALPSIVFMQGGVLLVWYLTSGDPR
jgi:hypothetical protein